MLTIFAIPKAFSGHIGTIQRNAILSWTRLSPRPEIILFGDDSGTAEFAAELGLKHIPKVARNEYGTPLLNDLFQQAVTKATNGILCYVNADIILLSDFISTIQRLPFKSFLMVGQRWNLEIQQPLNFEDPSWEHKLREQIRQSGRLLGVGGIDYFIFNRDLPLEVPPLAIGRLWWDDWFLYRARFLRVPLIDATNSITIVHQNHDYAHHPQGEQGVWKGVEMKRNLEIMGGYESVFSLDDADYIATATGFHKPAWNRKRLLRHLHVQAIIDPAPTRYTGWKKLLFAKRSWSDYKLDYFKKRFQQLRNLITRQIHHNGSQRSHEAIK